MSNNKFHKLKAVISELREKCPWDREQNFETLRSLTIEEVYELSEEIINKRHEGIEEEVGDLLLHVMFYSKLGEEKGKFSIESVIKKLILKLKRRHPHIYRKEKKITSRQVESNWEKIKRTEKKSKNTLENIPNSIPPMVKSMIIQKKVKSVGFDWEEKKQVLRKIEEEYKELSQEIKKNDHQENIKNEIGDLIFSVINLARFIGIDPEESLERTNMKFIKRFNLMEEMIEGEGKDLKKMKLEEMDKYWEKSKEKINE